jgi:hypothetical protein
MLSAPGKVNKNNNRRVTNRSIMARKMEPSGRPIYTENRNIVSALIATIKKLTGGIHVEAAWIVPASPLFSLISQNSIRAYRKDSDTVIQSVTGIDKSAIGRNQYLRAEITAGKSGRQSGYRLS